MSVSIAVYFDNNKKPTHTHNKIKTKQNQSPEVLTGDDLSIIIYFEISDM